MGTIVNNDTPNKVRKQLRSPEEFGIKRNFNMKLRQSDIIALLQIPLQSHRHSGRELPILRLQKNVRATKVFRFS